MQECLCVNGINEVVTGSLSIDDTPGDQLADSAQKYQSEELTAR